MRLIQTFKLKPIPQESLKNYNEFKWERSQQNTRVQTCIGGWVWLELHLLPQVGSSTVNLRSPFGVRNALCGLRGILKSSGIVYNGRGNWFTLSGDLILRTLLCGDPLCWCSDSGNFSLIMHSSRWDRSYVRLHRDYNELRCLLTLTCSNIIRRLFRRTSTLQCLLYSVVGTYPWL